MTAPITRRPGRASPRRRPGTSTSAAPGPRCSTGSSCASTEGRSSCALRTPTRRATGPSGPTGSSPRSTGSACPPTRGRTSSRRRRTCTRRRSRRCGTAARSTPARARGRRSTSGRRQRAAAGDPTPGYDGHCRDLGLARGEGRALRFRTPDEGVVEVHDLVRGDVEFPQRALEDFICVKGNGKPLFVLANAVDDRTMAISHVIRGEDQLPTTPRQIMLWGALEPGRGRGPGAAGVRPPAACWSTSRGRSSPSGATRWRWRCTASRATCRRPSATTWRCWAGARATRRSCRWR